MGSSLSLVLITVGAHNLWSNRSTIRYSQYEKLNGRQNGDVHLSVRQATEVRKVYTTVFKDNEQEQV
jgi:hypothetical protein